MTLDPTLLSRAVAQAYGLEGSLARLAGENENFELTLADGRRFVLKVAEPGASRERLELEHEAVEAVAAAVPELALPRVVPTSAGGGVATLAAGGPPRLGRLLRFVPGAPWAPPGSATQLAERGRLAARLALALGPIDRPAAHTTHRWDLSEALAHRASLGRISDPLRRRLLDEVLERFAAYRQDLRSVPHGLIHGDLNDDNLRLEGGRLTGVLDFGDVLHNPWVNELGIALAYALLASSEPWQAGATVVAAYHEVRALTATEVELLYPLLTARLAVSLLVSAERRALDPTRAAWFVTEEAAWAFLERQGRLDPVEVADQLAQGIEVAPYPDRGPGPAALLERRRAHGSRAQSLSYREPIQFVRGRGAFLLDERGRPFLDLYNNVCHVGHCHPHVVAAGAAQMARLNTNTRYLTEAHGAYVERLAGLLPPELPVVFLVSSGSEANELALRLARCHTGRQDLVVMDNAYHGHTQALIEASPYKFLGPGGRGRAEPWVQVLPPLDLFRGLRHVRSGQEHEDEIRGFGQRAARFVAKRAKPPAAFLAETLLSCGGQVIPPQCYFEDVFAAVRARGGVCILDEVQVGFGRVGSHFWAFEAVGVLPDIVVMGKPMGNGHPLAAVACRREIAASFEATGMEFFATFGGNPVSCAIGSAVLDVIEQEGLQRNALQVGWHAEVRLRELQERHRVIGDVRGWGLFLGLELVEADGLTPAPALAKQVVDALRDERILTGTDGPFHNVIKIKPPLVVTREDIDRFVDALGRALEGEKRS
jgi:4-aminobutyrate aminotransferase-like enzyme/Ser/Thr protein kinase RdoA (MazF antagonist)